MADDDLTPEKKKGFYDWSPIFLEALMEVPNVSRAARRAGVTRPKAYYHRDRNEAFAQAWDEALEVGVDALEEEMWRRAVEGIPNPIYYKGQLIDEIKEYSDTLAIFLAKAHRPEKFRERYDVTSAGEKVTPVAIINADTEKLT